MMNVVNIFGFEYEEPSKCFDNKVLIKVFRKGLVYELNANCLDSEGKIKRHAKDLISLGTIQSHVILHQRFGATITVI